MRILNITTHPCNAASVLGWMLYKWELNPNEPLLIVTMAGDGKDLVNRVRVRLSNARKTLKKSNVPATEFTIRAAVNRWGQDENTIHEAVTFEREVGLRHRLSELIKDATPGV